MSKAYKQRFLDMLDSIQFILESVQDKDFSDFEGDRTLRDSINMNLVVIGESANRVPESMQQSNPHIAWRNIVGLRNVIAHDYFRLRYDVLWNVVTVELPRLDQQIREILERETDNGV